MNENYSQTSARRTKPRFWPQARALAFNAKGGEPAEPTAERHPQCDPGENLTIAFKQSVLAGDVKSNAKGEKPAEATEWHPYWNPCVWTTMMQGFTMAEILLSLTIIGVVAAITLPSLTGNINERTWNTQRKALYARFSQAIALMPALNGYGTLTEDSSSGASDAVDTAAETFVTNGLSKVMKINNICDNEHLADCGISSKITTLGGVTIVTPADMTALNSYMTSSMNDGAGGSISLINSKAAAFETQNGESILVYYNPSCVGSLQEAPWGGTVGYFIQNKVCANFIYDLNGTKGPNTVGKDIGFLTVLYPSDVKVAAPVPANKPLSSTYNAYQASKACTEFDSQYRLPNVDEIISMFVNMNLLQSNSSGFNGNLFMTSERVVYNNALQVLVMNVSDGNKMGQVDDIGLEFDRGIWCVKR